jgi:FkbM family methyltransferase
MSDVRSLIGKQLDNAPLTLADVGAVGGIHTRWRPFKPWMRVVAFEPDKRAAQRDEDAKTIWVAAALADTPGARTLNVTRHLTGTSLLMPNRPVIDNIFADPSSFDVVAQPQVVCTTLDRAVEEHGFEFDAVKIDTQGTELDILRGGKSMLATSLIAVETEVEFIPLYEGQALFCEVNGFLQQQDFMLLDLGNALYHKWRSAARLDGMKGQLISADALYVLPPAVLATRVTKVTHPAVLVAKGCAVALAYGYPGLAVQYAEACGRQDTRVHSFAQEIRGALEAYVMPYWRGLAGLGRVSQALHELGDWLRPKHHACWLNRLGNRAKFRSG